MSYGATENFGCAQSGMPQVLKVRRLQIFAISPEKVGNEVIFSQQINMKVFCKLIVSLWVYVARHTQITQNNKFSFFTAT